MGIKPQTVVEALVEAFPEPHAMRHLVVGLGSNPYRVVTGEQIDQMALDIFVWCESRGLTRKMLTVAIRLSKTAPKLVQLAASVGVHVESTRSTSPRRTWTERLRRWVSAREDIDVVEALGAEVLSIDPTVPAAIGYRESSAILQGLLAAEVWQRYPRTREAAEGLLQVLGESSKSLPADQALPTDQAQRIRLAQDMVVRALVADRRDLELRSGARWSLGGGLVLACGLMLVLRGTTLRWITTLAVTVALVAGCALLLRLVIERPSWRSLSWNRRIGWPALVLAVFSGSVAFTTRAKYTPHHARPSQYVPDSWTPVVEFTMQPHPSLDFVPMVDEDWDAVRVVIENSGAEILEIERVVVTHATLDASERPFLTAELIDSTALTAFERNSSDLAQERVNGVVVSSAFAVVDEDRLFDERGVERDEVAGLGMVIRNRGGAVARDVVMWPFSDAAREELGINSASRLTLGELPPAHGLVVSFPLHINPVAYATRKKKKLAVDELQLDTRELAVLLQTVDPRSNEPIRREAAASGEVLFEPGLRDLLLDYGLGEAYRTVSRLTYDTPHRRIPWESYSRFRGRTAHAADRRTLTVNLEPAIGACDVKGVRIRPRWSYDLIIRFTGKGTGLVDADIEVHGAGGAVLAGFTVRRPLWQTERSLTNGSEKSSAGCYMYSPDIAEEIERRENAARRDQKCEPASSESNER